MTDTATLPSRSDEDGADHWMGLLTAAVAVALSLPLWTAPWNVYDGGISAASAGFTLHGLLPYRDYWLLYGPLAGWLLALPTAVFGPSVELTRLVGLVLLAGQATIVYRLCRRWTISFWSSLLAVSSTLLVAAFMGLAMSAWTLAMTLALGAISLRLAGGRPLTVGVLLGLAFLARLDVGAYALLASLLLPSRRSMIVGFGAVVVPVGVAFWLLVPTSALFEQLVWYPLVGPRQYRGVPGLDVQMPPAIALLLTAVLALMPRVIVGVALIRSVVEKRRDVFALAVFACLCQLQTLGRADAAHLAAGSTPALVLVAAILPRLPRYSVLAMGLVAPALVAASAIGVLAAMSQPTYRDVALQRAIALVRLSTQADDAVLVGLASHRHTLVNSMLAYYLVDRPPGTRWTMYNPGVTNTDATQTGMVRDLEASSTKLLILDVEWAEAFEATNDSRLAGSLILDRYIQEHFRTWCDFGAYRVAMRSTSELTRPCPATPS